MKKVKKIKLEDLKVKSFVTALSNQDKATVNGGIFNMSEGPVCDLADWVGTFFTNDTCIKTRAGDCTHAAGGCYMPDYHVGSYAFC